MTPRPSNIVRWLALTLALGLTALALVVLACGPSAPAGQAGTAMETTSTPTPTYWIIGDASPSELATAMATTSTPYPPGYVPPTPHPTALTNEEIGATLVASMTREAAQYAQASSPTATPAPTPTAVPLTEQVTRFAREERYDVIAHIRAGASRNVTVPPDVEWPRNHGTFPALTRTLVTPVTTYYGTLPTGYELIVPQGITWAVLDDGQEYVLFISKIYASASTCSEGRDPGQRCLNQEQLDAVGGPGGLYIGQQAWIVDGDQTWRIPDDSIDPPFPENLDLTVEARSGGEGLPLTELERAIRSGLPK